MFDIKTKLFKTTVFVNGLFYGKPACLLYYWSKQWPDTEWSHVKWPKSAMLFNELNQWKKLDRTAIDTHQIKKLRLWSLRLIS